MSNATRETLLESLTNYENQLTQIKLAVTATPAGSDREDLCNLQRDIEELISLTRENLLGLDKKTQNNETEDEFSKEYALFKAELADLNNSGSRDVKDTGPENEAQLSELNNSETREQDEVEDTGPDIENELESLVGLKCQAPYKQKWGGISYHNALIVGVETSESISDINHIEVRVLFVNPTENDMRPCPYYLSKECKFSDEQCHYSHGERVNLSEIREYRDPDFRRIKEACIVLAKFQSDLWKRARVLTIIDDDRCKVKFDCGGSIRCLDLHELLPLDDVEEGDNEAFDSSLMSAEEESDRDKLVELSLLRTPASKALGDWEKHTKGIGSKLMASMGYIVGLGLGKNGEGRLEPVEALVFPPGKSLDHCMALREAAGGDANLFKAERKLRKQQQQEMKRRKKEYERDTDNVFDFINTKLAGPSTSSSKSKVSLTDSSNKGLNVERFKLGEDIRRTERDVAKLKESLQRQDKGSASYNTLANKLRESQNQLSVLQSSERNIAKEQDQRQTRKKFAVF